LGFNIECEILTIDGRIDAVLLTEKFIYIIEFKVGNTTKAINQIIEKQYYMKYTGDSRKKIAIGIDFDAENKTISNFEIVEL